MNSCWRTMFLLLLLVSVVSVWILSQFQRDIFHFNSSTAASLQYHQQTRALSNHNSSKVTRRIHQTWKTHELPPRFQLYSKSWHQCYQQWEYHLWDDVENRDLIKNHFPWFLKYYDSLPRAIYRADAIRYFIMYRFGGIYADLDTDCLKPFDHLLENYSIVFGAMEGQYGVTYKHQYIQNSFFYSRPGHPFWLDVAKDMLNIKTGSPERRTGPIMLLKNIKRWERKYGHTWKVYPPYFFNPFSWLRNSHNLPTTCKGLNRMSLEDYQDCRNYFVKRGSFVVQYHTQTWGSGHILR